MRFRSRLPTLLLAMSASPLFITASCSKSSGGGGGGGRNPRVDNAGDDGSGGGPGGSNGQAGGGGTEERYGLSPEDFEKGRAFVNGWSGEADELPADAPWILASLPDEAVLPPSTEPLLPPAQKVVYEGQVKTLLDRACISCH